MFKVLLEFLSPMILLFIGIEYKSIPFFIASCVIAILVQFTEGGTFYKKKNKKR